MASNNTARVASSSELKDHLAATAIITLAGENNGAAMDDVAEDLVVVSGNADDAENQDQQGGGEEEEESVVTSAYSSYQAVVNISVPPVAGSCDDPGVQVIVVEHVDEIRDYDQEDDDIDGAYEF